MRVGKGAAVVRRLRRARYDAAFGLQGLFRSGLIGFLSVAKQVIGMANARERAPIFYGKRVELSADEKHSVERYIFVAGGDAATEREFPIALSPEDTRIAADLLADIGYNPGTPFSPLVPGTRGEMRRWPEENLAALAGWLVKRGGVQAVPREGRTEKQIALMGDRPAPALKRS